MRAVDTNVLIRLFTRDDSNQALIADRFIEDGAWVPQLVVVEAIWVLASVYRRSTADLIGYIEICCGIKTSSFKTPTWSSRPSIFSALARRWVSPTA